MRRLLLAILLASAQTVAAMALETQTPTARHRIITAPSFDQCYRLGWDRGVHVEMHAMRDELEEWMDDCTAGTIPFDNAGGFASGRPGAAGPHH